MGTPSADEKWPWETEKEQPMIGGDRNYHVTILHTDEGGPRTQILESRSSCLTAVAFLFYNSGEKSGVISSVWIDGVKRQETRGSEKTP